MWHLSLWTWRTSWSKALQVFFPTVRKSCRMTVFSSCILPWLWTQCIMKKGVIYKTIRTVVNRKFRPHSQDLVFNVYMYFPHPACWLHCIHELKETSSLASQVPSNTYGNYMGLITHVQSTLQMCLGCVTMFKQNKRKGRKKIDWKTFPNCECFD